MKILVAIQDRAIFAEMLSYLSKHFSSEQTEIKVIHVIDQPHAAYHVDMELHALVHRRGEEIVTEAANLIQKAIPSAKVRKSLLEGDPKSEIVKTAKSMPADLIVMGSHGRGAIGRMLLGSVSLAVLAAAPCSLLVLRPPQPTKNENEG